MNNSVLLECDVLIVGEWFPTFRMNSTHLSSSVKGKQPKKQPYLKTVLSVTSRLAVEHMLLAVRSRRIKRLGLEAYYSSSAITGLIIRGSIGSTYTTP